MFTMATLAMAYLVLLEPFLAAKLGGIKRPPPPPVKDDRVMSTDYKAPTLTKFFLYTPISRIDGRLLNPTESETFDNFDPDLESKVIVHGFLDQVRIADWMHTMKDEFLRYGDYNVIVVDWSLGNTIPYSRAAANTERVGGEIADIISYLRERKGARTETFHIIGHSLGSHVAGFVGERIKPLKRITGLDPAMYHFKGAKPSKRLDKNDAIFVDAIHSDAGGIGMVEHVGHIDFYPNGGSTQPGCTAVNYFTSLVQKGVVESVRNLICSHMRAILLFIESINSQICQFRASKCRSWRDYEDGRCGGCGHNGQNCAIMGLHTDTTRQYGNSSYFLMTASHPPYCVVEYRVKFYEAGIDNRGFGIEGLLPPAWRDREGLNGKSFTTTLIGSSSQAEVLLEENNLVGEGYYVFTSPRDLGHIESVILRWRPKPLGAVADTFASMMRQQRTAMPLIDRVEITAINAPQNNRNEKYSLCASPSSMDSQASVIGLRNSLC